MLAVVALATVVLQSVSTDAFVNLQPTRCRATDSLISSLAKHSSAVDEQRRRLLGITVVSSLYFTDSACASQVGTSVVSSFDSAQIKGVEDISLRNYRNTLLPNWQGTSLDVMSLQQAADLILSQQSPCNATFPMGRWPDPILRKAASTLPISVFQSTKELEQLQLVASALKNTARKEGAVGLAAQQCGIDASLIFVDDVNERQNNSDTTTSVSGEGKTISASNSRQGIFLVNPRIIKRSKESAMLVWTEECLVLPPEFRATLLRDESVTIEYETLDGKACGVTKQIRLEGELARCAQHEMDHNCGVLIVDHVGLDELLTVDGNDFMASIENSDGMHQARMQRAYSRDVVESTLLLSREKMIHKVEESYNGPH